MIHPITSGEELLSSIDFVQLEHVNGKRTAVILHGIDYLGYQVGETWHELNTFAQSFARMRETACGFVCVTMEEAGFWHRNWVKAGADKALAAGSNHSLLAQLFGKSSNGVRRVRMKVPEEGLEDGEGGASGVAETEEVKAAARPTSYRNKGHERRPYGAKSGKGAAPASDQMLVKVEKGGLLRKMREQEVKAEMELID